MAKKSDYVIGDIYQGGYSTLKPSSDDLFMGYRLDASRVGAPTKPDTANQIQQVNMLLNQGIVPIEVQTLPPEVFDQIPKQHFTELRRAAKLGGAKMSVHAPLIEASGMTREGWSDSTRELAERQLWDVVQKSHEMDENGGIPITIHSSGIPGKEMEMTKEGPQEAVIQAINQETHQVQRLKREMKYYPGEDLDKGIIFTPQRELDALNNTDWQNSLYTLVHQQHEADKIIGEYSKDILPFIENGAINKEAVLQSEVGDQALGQLRNAEAYLEDARLHINGLFNKAYKYGTEEDKIKLRKISEEYGKELEKIEGDVWNVGQKSHAIQGVINALGGISPKTFIPIEDWAVEQSSKTFANVALKSYEKYGDKSPTISIENLYPGMAFGYADEMKRLITKSRDTFVEEGMKKGLSSSEAKEKAEKIIGMTLDVGHLNIQKKGGYKDEDLQKEVKEMSKFVKHVHLTDNFGYSDSHLSPGMGNVPFKKILEELEKKGFQGNAVVEAGGLVQHFGTSPYPFALEAMGSPIYSMKMAPYWNQTSGLQQGYFGGYGGMLPQKNYETFGAGFSQLPAELGGKIGGGTGRISGNPME